MTKEHHKKKNWETQDAVNRESLEVSGLANNYYEFRDVWVVMKVTWRS